MAVDASGNVAYDPSQNVIALVEANAKSAAMLRGADIKFNDAEIAHVKEIATLRALNAETMRLGDLDRLASTRQVDVLAASATAAALATAVQTLSKQTSDLAITLAAQTDSKLRDVDARIGELQKSSYQGGGKSEGMDSLWKMLVVGAGLLLAFLTYQSSHAAPSQPVNIVMPASTPTQTTTTTMPAIR
jgi:hypothetical protein